MRLRGHALAGDGGPYDPTGILINPRTNPANQLSARSTSGPGHAKCACGVLSTTTLGSLTARRAWHREHKATVR